MEFGHLLEENRHLTEELKQCQADKDFVWSLWKKLQVSNPDVTEAVGLVVKREREKAELRDRKVLEILQRKDEKIEDLQAAISSKQQQLGESTIRRDEDQEEVTRLRRQMDAMQERNASLELQPRTRQPAHSKATAQTHKGGSPPRSGSPSKGRSFSKPEGSLSKGGSPSRSGSPSKGRSLSKQEASPSKGRSLSKQGSPVRGGQEKSGSGPQSRRKADKLDNSKRQEIRTYESREKNLDATHRDAMHDLDQEKNDLKRRLQLLNSELEKIRTEKADEMALRVQMESKVRVLDREVTGKIGKFEELVRELEEARSLLRRFETQVRQQQKDLDYKNGELETVRAELAELWSTHNQLTEHSGQQADLIHQIQSLQTDTQKMMKNQESAYALESNSIQSMYTELTSRYDQAKKAESDLRSQVLALKKEMMDKDDVIAELQEKLHRQLRFGGIDNSGSFLADEKVEPVLDLEYKVKSMQREMDNLRKKLAQRDGKIDQLEEDAINQTIEFDVARLNRHERTHSTPCREFRSVGLSPMKVKVTEPVAGAGRGSRSRSLSPSRKERQPKPRYHIQKDLDDCRAILKLKMRELAELKKAHSKRQERLKTVQDNYKNVKDQLRTIEAEYYGSKKKKKPRRADPKELRHEDSGAVWNELAYFRNENRNMAVERMALEEELDSMKVQSSQDAATVHELRVALTQEREEQSYGMKKMQREIEGVSTQKSEIVLLKSEVQNKDVVIDRLERDLRDIAGDKDVLLDEKRVLKADIVELKKEASQHRMDQADLRRDIKRLKRELDEERSISKLNANKAAAAANQGVKTVILKPAGNGRGRRKGQRSRSHFNTSASKKFEELIEDGWEEMSGDSEQEEETGTDTLGRNIVHRSRLGMPDSSTTDSSSYRIRRAMPMKQSSRARNATRQHLERMQEPPPPPRHTEARATAYRDAATSPGGISPAVKEAPAQPRRSPAALASSAAAGRQLKQMKQRVGYLQQQVVTLRDSRAAALKTLEELKETNTQLQADINLANQRLRMSKQTIQKLNNDLDKLHTEKKDMEGRLTQKMENVAPGDTGHSDHDWRVLESRLKSSSSELTRQNAAVRQLKQENESQTDQIRQLQDKVNRAERDSSQKRSLLEDQRSRVKQALENAKADAESLEQLETRQKLLQDTNEKQKTQLESYKKRLGAVTREKREYEEQFLKLTADVEKKNKLLLDSQSKKADLELSLTEMERLATNQMKSLARESEGALETAQEKLKEIHYILQAYQRFVKNLGHEIVRRTQKTRHSLREVEQRRAAQGGGDRPDASLQRAQNLAKDILNLSQSDLDDIMSADGDTSKMETELEQEKRRDKKWMKKVDRLQNSKDEFAMALMDLFLQKIEERNELTTKLWTTRQTEVKVSNT